MFCLCRLVLHHLEHALSQTLPSVCFFVSSKVDLLEFRHPGHSRKCFALDLLGKTPTRMRYYKWLHLWTIKSAYATLLLGHVFLVLCVAALIPNLLRLEKLPNYLAPNGLPTILTLQLWLWGTYIWLAITYDPRGIFLTFIYHWKYSPISVGSICI